MTETTLDATREWGRAEVEASVRGILANSLAVPEAEVTPEASLVRDLGAESIDFLDIGFNVQQTLGVSLQTADIRSRSLAWASLIHPALAEILHERYGVTAAVEELRTLEQGGLTKIVEHLQATNGLGAHPEAMEELGRGLVRRLVRELDGVGFRVSGPDQDDLLAVMRDDLTARRLTERTLDLLTVGALVDFICGKLGPRLRA
jgi:acyl carrier protein